MKGLTAKVSGWLKASPLERRVDPKAKKGRPDLKTGTTHAKALSTEAAQHCKNDSWWRLAGKRWRPKRLEPAEANAGEAPQSAKTPKEKPWRKAKRWS